MLAFVKQIRILLSGSRRQFGLIRSMACQSKLIFFLIIIGRWGTWVAQSVELLASAQVMISWFVGSSPTLGSVLTAQSLESALDFVSPTLSLPFPNLCLLSLSFFKINKH